MAVVTLEVGADATIASLKAWAARTRTATETGVQKAGKDLKALIQSNLDQRHYPPSSPPGTPPARRTGWLHDNVYQRTVQLASGYQERVYPTAVYARIHELSGWTGAGHALFLPKRPYVGPALDEYRPQFRPAMAAAWREAMPGR